MRTADSSQQLAQDEADVYEAVDAWLRTIGGLPAEPPPPPRVYSTQFSRAMAWAADLHSGQTRKGKSEPSSAPDDCRVPRAAVRRF